MAERAPMSLKSSSPKFRCAGYSGLSRQRVWRVEFMRRRDAIALVGSAAIWPAIALGQQHSIVPQIGWIILGSPAGRHPDIFPYYDSFSYYDSFRAGLHELGYVEGNNLTI